MNRRETRPSSEPEASACFRGRDAAGRPARLRARARPDRTPGREATSSRSPARGARSGPDPRSRTVAGTRRARRRDARGDPRRLPRRPRPPARGWRADRAGPNASSGKVPSPSACANPRDNPRRAHSLLHAMLAARLMMRPWLHQNSTMDIARSAALRRGVRLEVVTIAWMLVEAAVALGAGIAARSVLLTAFGVDSIVELLSGVILYRRLAADSNQEAVDIGRLREQAHQVTARRLRLT